MTYPLKSKRKSSKPAPCFEAHIAHADGWNYRAVIADVDSTEEAFEVL